MPIEPTDLKETTDDHSDLQANDKTTDVQTNGIPSNLSNGDCSFGPVQNNNVSSDTESVSKENESDETIEKVCI